MPRGGRRSGTPGKGYSNRTDLLTVRAPATGATTPASGGVPAPATTTVPDPGQPTVQTPAWISPDQVPALTDPSARPDEPLTAGLASGPGPGPEALGPMPMNKASAGLVAAFQANPTPELRRAMLNAKARGIL